MLNMRVFSHWPYQLLAHNDVPINHSEVCECVCVLWVYTSRTQSQWILLTASVRGRHGEGRWSRVNGWFILSLKCSSFSSYKESSAGWKWSGAREKSGKWSWEAACFFFLFFLMETSIWQGHGPSSFISICGLSLISCPPVYLPHLSAGRCLRYTNFMTDPSPIKKEWVCNFLSHINTHIPVCLSCPSVRDSVMLFGCLSLWWPARSKMPTDPACQRETLHSCSLPRWQTSPTLRF